MSVVRSSIAIVVGLFALPLCLGAVAGHLDRAMFVPFDVEDPPGVVTGSRLLPFDQSAA